MYERFRVRSRWVKMLSRCEDDDNPQYHNYGGRGIYVCDEWREFDNFYRWCIDAGIDPDLQLDRIDNDGPYSPDNCRFVTRKDNIANRSVTVWIEAFGEKKTLVDWLEDDRCNVGYATLAARIRNGWDSEEAIVFKPKEVNRYQKRKNKRTDPRYISMEAWGDSKTFDKWVNDDRCAVSIDDRITVWKRINRLGWTVEKALSTPVGKRKKV